MVPKQLELNEHDWGDSIKRDQTCYEKVLRFYRLFYANVNIGIFISSKMEFYWKWVSLYIKKITLAFDEDGVDNTRSIYQIENIL